MNLDTVLGKNAVTPDGPNVWEKIWLPTSGVVNLSLVLQRSVGGDLVWITQAQEQAYMRLM